MQSTPKHGLAGKARRVRDITRSHRLHSQQLIGEYLDWETGEEEPERVIPIKRGGEFLPSAEYLQSSSPDDSGAGQFEFVHTPSGAIVDTAAVAPQSAPVTTSLAPTAEVKPAAARTKTAVPVVHAEVAPKSATHVTSATLPKPAITLKPASVARPASTMAATPVTERPEVIRPLRPRTSVLSPVAPAPTLSARGLLVGCAIGTAGAGTLLAIASLLFG